MTRGTPLLILTQVGRVGVLTTGATGLGNTGKILSLDDSVKLKFFSSANIDDLMP